MLILEVHAYVVIYFVFITDFWYKATWWKQNNVDFKGLVRKSDFVQC